MSITVTLQELTGLQEEDRAGELLWCRLAIKQPASLRFGRTSAVACSASGDGFFGEDVVFTGLASAPGNAASPLSRLWCSGLGFGYSTCRQA